ncbi:hypothetical protein GCM10009122_24530 [Fulvivirga kasyanovii]
MSCSPLQKVDKMVELSVTKAGVNSQPKKEENESEKDLGKFGRE